MRNPIAIAGLRGFHHKCVSLTSINIRRLPLFQIGQKVGGFYGQKTDL
jgi:hypothetical protein